MQKKCMLKTLKEAAFQPVKALDSRLVENVFIGDALTYSLATCNKLRCKRLKPLTVMVDGFC